MPTNVNDERQYANASYLPPPRVPNDTNRTRLYTDHHYDGSGLPYQSRAYYDTSGKHQSNASERCEVKQYYQGMSRHHYNTHPFRVLPSNFLLCTISTISSKATEALITCTSMVLLLMPLLYLNLAMTTPARPQVSSTLSPLLYPRIRCISQHCIVL